MRKGRCHVGGVASHSATGFQTAGERVVSVNLENPGVRGVSDINEPAECSIDDVGISESKNIVVGHGDVSVRGTDGDAAVAVVNRHGGVGDEPSSVEEQLVRHEGAGISTKIRLARYLKNALIDDRLAGESVHRTIGKCHTGARNRRWQ